MWCDEFAIIFYYYYYFIFDNMCDRFTSNTKNYVNLFLYVVISEKLGTCGINYCHILENILNK